MNPQEKAMSEGGKRGGRSNRRYVETEPGHKVKFVLKWLDGSKSFLTLDELRSWLRVQLVRESSQRLKNFTEYEISRVETFTLERRFAGGEPIDVYRSQEVDGALPQG
jgi:hypothetical protein